jgi:hypothetical protein
MEILFKAIGDLLGAVLPPILTWFFSGTVTDVVKTVPGVPNLDTKAAPDAPLDLPILGNDNA